MLEKEAIAIVDDDESIRKALVRMLTAAGLEPRAFSSAKELFAAASTLRVSCIVSDLRMPETDGLQLQRQLSEQMPNAAIVFLTGHGDVSASVQAMKSGAVDFLEKPVRHKALLEAIERATRRAHSGEAETAKLNQLRKRYDALTPRERQVFGLVTVGLLNKQIAAELGAAEKTIKQHRGVVMRKMRADSLADLVLMAHHLGARPSHLSFSRARGILRPN